MYRVPIVICIYFNNTCTCRFICYIHIQYSKLTLENVFVGLANPTDYEPSLDGMPYTTLSYGNGPGVNFTAGRENLTNVDISMYLFIILSLELVSYFTTALGSLMSIFKRKH